MDLCDKSKLLYVNEHAVLSSRLLLVRTIQVVPLINQSASPQFPTQSTLRGTTSSYSDHSFITIGRIVHLYPRFWEESERFHTRYYVAFWTISIIKVCINNSIIYSKFLLKRHYTMILEKCSPLDVCNR